MSNHIFNLLWLTPTFPTEKEHNISLKESANTDSQISSNDETSLNNNIKRNFSFGSQAGFNK